MRRLANQIKRHPRMSLMISVLVAVIVAAGSVFYAAKQISSPSRRVLMDYHREILDAASDHGMRIERYDASGTPCLLCIPDPSGKIGKRGVILREQLEARSIALKPPGEIIGNSRDSARPIFCASADSCA